MVNYYLLIYRPIIDIKNIILIIQNHELIIYNHIQN